ncbi:uncharacterized protein LOC143781318 [Ranitomeya variabilis]|uniref:uncharacterized protein LOC143781318 n=1 Tax=Ranitomeya variabilis TaxID=490064 RepID=UPI0040579125
MEVSMKYRTQGSLPISSQHKAQYIPQYIPRIPEEPAPSSRGKAKLEVPVLQDRSDEDHEKQQLAPEFPTHPTTKLEPLRFRRPAHDPCKAIIETSPYYIYFKIITTEDARKTQDKDLKSVLSELVVIDEDLPRTAKYRHFRSYEQ